MGKLGGHELNYSSDVDVLFVHDGDQVEADARGPPAARGDGRAVAGRDRVPHRRRPPPRGSRPGRSPGASTRTAAWYERWAQTWEFQALIKSRPVAGDAELGAGFAKLVEPFVWPDVLGPDAVRAVRAMKARAEGETHRRGLDDRELKRGRGGIRDIEFAVQLLQLVHGRHDPTIRSAQHARRARAARRPRATSNQTRRGAVRRGVPVPAHRRAPAAALGRAADPHAARPTSPSRTRLARVLGYRDQRPRLRRGAARRRAPRAPGPRALHPREAVLRSAARGARPVGPGRSPPDAAEERLRAFGFLDLRATRAALDELTRGFSRTSRLMEQLLPLLLEWCSESPDPDLALLQLRRLAEGPARSANLATVFRDTPGAAQRTCRILGSSRMLGDALRRQPEFVQTLGDDDALVDAEAARAVRRRGGRGRRVAGQRRERAAERAAAVQAARAAAHRVARPARRSRTSSTTGRDLSTLAEACLEASLVVARAAGAVRGHRHGSLRRARPLVRVGPRRAVRLRRRRCRPTTTRPNASPSSCCVEIGERTTEGRTFAIDATLRPEGKQGSLTRSLAGLPQLLGALRAHVGVPGAHQGAARGRRPRARADASASWPSRSSTGTRSPTRRCRRSGG